MSDYTCAARRQGSAGGNAPADCDWPHCGCDPAADKVLEALQEEGYIPPREARELIDALRWFVTRKFTLQAKFDLWGPEDTAAAMKEAFKKAEAALRAVDPQPHEHGN